jgi:hypothetical protein
VCVLQRGRLLWLSRVCVCLLDTPNSPPDSLHTRAHHTHTHRTITHQPPEVLAEGGQAFTPAADVYAWGVLLWVSGARCCFSEGLLEGGGVCVESKEAAYPGAYSPPWHTPHTHTHQHTPTHINRRC